MMPRLFGCCFRSTYLHKIALLFTLLWVCFSNTAVTAATVYDATLDFSATSNPAGVWSYGYRTTVASNALSLYTNRGNISSIDFWWFGSGLPDLGFEPALNRLILHPGNTLALASYSSVLRWTTPADGTYNLTSTFTGVDNRGINAISYVVRNGNIDFQGAIQSLGQTYTYANTYSLLAGDVLDFVVGNNGTAFIGDRHFTRVDATISSVPIPSALWLFGAGSLSLIGIARRKKA